MASSFVIGTLLLVSAGLSFGIKAVQLGTRSPALRLLLGSSLARPDLGDDLVRFV
jgi:hypothetical protein